MAVHFQLGQGVAELTDGGARRVVDEHFLRPGLRRDVVHHRHALVEEVPAPGLQIAAHPIIGDALPFQAGDELAGHRVEVREQVGKRLARRLLHRQHLDELATDGQMVAVAFDRRVGDEVVQVRVVVERGRAMTVAGS